MAPIIAKCRRGVNTLVAPRGPRRGDSRVLRGGHYNSVSAACTVYDRGWYVPSGKSEFYGLRLVLEVTHDED